MTKNNPFPVPRKEVDASNIINIGSIRSTYPEQMLEVLPGGQEAVSLGEYTTETEPATGFIVEVMPKECESSVVARMARLGATHDTFELILHVANYSDKEITVEVIKYR